MPGTGPRILIVESAPRVTGSVRSISAAVGALKGQFRFTAMGCSPEVRDAIGVPWEQFDFAMPRKSELLTFGPRVLWQARQFVKVVERLGSELVHVNDMTNVVPLVARWLGGRYQLVYHLRLLPTSYIKSIYKPLSRLVLAFSDEVVCVSQAVVDALPSSRRIGLVPNGISVPARVVPDGIELNETSTVSATNSKRIEVLYLGHFHPGKGHDLAVEAFARAARQTPDMHLSFVGNETVDPAFSAKVRARVSALQLGDRVSFHGPVSDPTPHFIRASIVLNLSESESFSMVVLEAMVQGRPVIASRCGGPEELLADPLAGVLVGNRDIEAAAAALSELARDEVRRREMGAAARRVVAERFDVRVTSRQLADVYQNVLALR